MLCDMLPLFPPAAREQCDWEPYFSIWWVLHFFVLSTWNTSLYAGIGFFETCFCPSCRWYDGAYVWHLLPSYILHVITYWLDCLQHPFISMADTTADTTVNSVSVSSDGNIQLRTSKVNKFVCEWRRVFGDKPMSDLDSERWNMSKYTLKMLFPRGFWTAKFFHVLNDNKRPLF